MRKHSSRPKIKREDFNTQWNIHQKQSQYNALQDPHANYYFVSKAAKQRLKDLKSEMKRNTHKSPKTKEYIKQLHSKIKFELPQIKLPLLNMQAEKQQLRTSDRKLSQQFHLKIMTERGHEHQHYQSNINKLTSKKEQLDQLGRLNQKQTGRNNRSKKRLRAVQVSKQESRVNHDQFLSFLQRKKSELQLRENDKK